jgi:outer membrane protein OmpA-like peptidoglycan-associated protein
MKHLRLLMACTCAIVATATLAPRRAESQILKKIKDQAKSKVDQKKTDEQNHVLATTGKAVDSSMAKTGRAADATVDKVGSIADTAMNMTEHGVTSAAHSIAGKHGDNDAWIKAQLDSGRLVLAKLGFAPGAVAPNAQGVSILAKVAQAIMSTTATYLVESHVAEGGDAGANQALPEKRGAAVKQQLVADGVPATRLFVMSYGSQRPAANGVNSRIEIAKMQ